MTDATKREVLTDEELDTAYWSKTRGLRAVEQAVLAKVREMGGCHLVDGQPCVSAADARERERRAFLVGWTGGNPRSEPQVVTSSNFHAIRNDRYPPLTRPKPEGVTLSDGKVWRITVEGWKYLGHEFAYDAPLCHNPEDFEKVARYLRELDT